MQHLLHGGLRWLVPSLGGFDVNAEFKQPIQLRLSLYMPAFGKQQDAFVVVDIPLQRLSYADIAMSDTALDHFLSPAGAVRQARHYPHPRPIYYFVRVALCTLPYAGMRPLFDASSFAIEHGHNMLIFLRTVVPVNISGIANTTDTPGFIFLADHGNGSKVPDDCAEQRAAACPCSMRSQQLQRDG